VSGDYQTIAIERRDQVATLVLTRRAHIPGQAPPNRHWELANAFDELRADSSVRVIVLTGADGQFSVPPHSLEHDRAATPEDRSREYPVDPARTWHSMTGVIRTHQAMAEIEKPIVAKVNGDAIGFGQSLVFGSDLIVAVEDALIADHHLAMGEIEPGGHLFGTVPGDGGMALVPLYMTPARAKEYLMLGRPYRARELAALGIINYAVPREELDAKVDELVERLLKRPAYALAWTKRVANRRVVDHLNMTLDAGAGYEMTTFLQLDKQGWIEKRDLT
jgi:enoyl-CoA hydratase/carnithine racemase